MKYLNDLQILRGISIIFVILFHYNILENGYRGVDIFILLTGFLVYSQYDKNISIISFYSSRIKRIIILSYFIQLFILLYFSISEKYGISNIIDEYNHALLLISNIYYYYIGNDYFLSNTKKYFLHYWYISMDLHFYLIYPIFYKQNKASIVIFYVIHLYIDISNKSLSYYSLLSRLYEYLLGNLTFVYRILNNKYLKYANVFMLVYFMINKVSNSYLENILILLFIFLYLINQSQCNVISTIAKIGDISYTLYLIHYPLSLKNKSITILLLFIPSCYLLNYFYQKVNDFLLRKKLFYSIIFILIYYFICRYFSYSLSKSKLFVTRINSYSTTNSKICCDNYNYNIYDILIVGDSHSFRYLKNILIPIYRKGTNVYWKYVSTKWIINNYISLIYSISHFFYLIISINMISYLWYNFTISNLTKSYNKYIKYLKSKSKYLIVYKPIPTFNFSIDCRTVMERRIAIVNKNITVIPSLLNVELSKYLIHKDLSKYYCTNYACNLTYKNKCIYGDDNHLSHSFLGDIISEEKSDINKYFPNIKNNNQTCKYYIIYNNIIPYNWYFLKSKCIKSYYKKSLF